MTLTMNMHPCFLQPAFYCDSGSIFLAVCDLLPTDFGDKDQGHCQRDKTITISGLSIHDWYSLFPTPVALACVAKSSQCSVMKECLLSARCIQNVSNICPGIMTPKVNKRRLRSICIRVHVPKSDYYARRVKNKYLQSDLISTCVKAKIKKNKSIGVTVNI